LESLSSQVAADVREARQRQLRQALVSAGGNKSRAAALLGITRKTLYAWLREFEAEERT
jgi:transcriptional regulator of acetoin/glycerol metabolism